MPEMSTGDGLMRRDCAGGGPLKMYRVDAGRRVVFVWDRRRGGSDALAAKVEHGG